MRREVRRQLVTARFTKALVVSAIDGPRLLKDLARDLLVIAVGVAARVRRNLRSIDRHQPGADQPRLRAERQDLAEQAGKRVLVALDEARQRRVIGLPVSRKHPKSDVLLAGPLDRARGAHAARIRVEHNATIIAGS